MTQSPMSWLTRRMNRAILKGEPDGRQYQQQQDTEEECRIDRDLDQLQAPLDEVRMWTRSSARSARIGSSTPIKEHYALRARS